MEPGGRRGGNPPKILAEQLTLSQQGGRGGGDSAHHINIHTQIFRHSTVPDTLWRLKGLTVSSQGSARVLPQERPVRPWSYLNFSDMITLSQSEGWPTTCAVSHLRKSCVCAPVWCVRLDPLYSETRMNSQNGAESVLKTFIHLESSLKNLNY